MFDPLLPSFDAASQHGPRPLPLFLDMLRSETAASPELRARALEGLRAYQSAPRGPGRKPAPARYRKSIARVRDYGRPGDAGRPILFIPSLINPPFILDLAPDRSLLRWLAAEGLHPFLLDWGTPTPAERDMDLTRLVEHILLPILAKFDTPPILAGYCLGGTLALAAACAVPVAGLALIATPWRFSGYGDAARAQIAALWSAARAGCDAMGLVPMEVLQAGFWQLDPARTIAKYARFATLDGDSREAAMFVALEDWANGGAPLPYAAGAQMFDFFARDAAGWHVGGMPVDPARLACPAIEFVARKDRIVPAASAAGLPDRHETAAGHVGMIVGSRACAQLWQPLADWASTLPRPR